MISDKSVSRILKELAIPAANRKKIALSATLLQKRAERIYNSAHLPYA